MSLLHVYFHLRKQREFQQCLDQAKYTVGSPTASSGALGGGQLSTSGSGSANARSWIKPSSWTPSSVSLNIDVNARDQFGRTVLHLACSAVEPAALEFVRLILAHSHVNINIQDYESHWSPLHRALYAGNISAAILLLQRPEVDMFLKDVEGYTPYDVYNSTVDGTNPPVDLLAGRPYAELFTWGSNRNATLGFGDGDDRTMPEQVVIKRDESSSVTPRHETLKPLQVIDVSMSKLHTTIITAESKSNIRSCGFASGGRLGPGATTNSHSQFSLIHPQGRFPHEIVSLALGQDHTLAINSNGEVLSWGLNRFHQLGYAIEGLNRPTEEQVQAAARKITGPLRNQVVLGVACCKTASACWTSTQLFTWGTNNGQLGYDKTSQPQIIPRPVSTITEPVLGVAMTSSAMLVLLKNHDVICLHEGSYWKLTFNIPKFERGSRAMPKEKPEIVKVTANDEAAGSFALVSKAGDVFLFNTDSVPASKSDISRDTSNKRPTPQLVWAVRRQFTAVKDVALGIDGSLILCTLSGHVFVRMRILRATIGPGSSGLLHPPKSASSFKFHRISNLQRVFRVCANSSGAFAALRSDATLEPIALGGLSMTEDLDQIQPYKSILRSLLNKGHSYSNTSAPIKEAVDELQSLIHNEEEDAADLDITTDIQATMDMCEFLFLSRSNSSSKDAYTYIPSFAAHHGADILFRVDNVVIPVHRSILLARAPAILAALKGGVIKCASSDRTQVVLLDGKASQLRGRPCEVKIRGCSPLTILIFCHYIYTDRLISVWDRRIALVLSDRHHQLGLDVQRIKNELRTLASPKALKLPELEEAAQKAGRTTSTPTLSRDLGRLFELGQEEAAQHHDIVIMLGDRRVIAHSAILRARSPYFAGFFDEECWTIERRSRGDVLEVDLEIFNYRPMSYLFRYLYEDASAEIFDDIDFVSSSDQLVDFMFEIIACGNHLLLDRFINICSSVIIRHVNLYNVASILVDATHWNATTLVKSLHKYMAQNLETLLEGHLLDDLPMDIHRSFSRFVRDRQRDHHPYVRSGGNLGQLEGKWGEWLSKQDIPAPIVPKSIYPSFRGQSSASVSLVSFEVKDLEKEKGKYTHGRTNVEQVTSAAAEEGIFQMDGELSFSEVPKLSPVWSSPVVPVATGSQASLTARRVWKSQAVAEKASIKSIMEAEKQAAAANRPTPVVASPKAESSTPAPAMTKWTGWSSKPSQPPARAISQPSLGSADQSQGFPMKPGLGGRTESAQSLLPKQSGHAAMNIAASSPAKVADSRTSAVPGLGPLIVPTKSGNVSSQQPKRHKPSDSPAWSSQAPNVTPSFDPTASNTTSFAAIQEQQAAKPVPRGPAKTIKQIQDEEQEAAFLLWFEQESAKVQKQEALSSSNLNEPSGEPPSSSTEGTRHGRGRGHGSQRSGRGRSGRGGGGRGRGREGSSSKLPEVAHT